MKEKPEETTGRQAAQAPQVPEDAEIPETPKPGTQLRFGFGIWDGTHGVHGPR